MNNKGFPKLFNLFTYMIIHLCVYKLAKLRKVAQTDFRVFVFNGPYPWFGKKRKNDKTNVTDLKAEHLRKNAKISLCHFP